MKFSMTGQENATFRYGWQLNRGSHMDRFDCNYNMTTLVYI
jgi:hypothetical protein